ncbi:MAG: two-component regulator propeller domain-containing protein [Marinilabiliales bacterium]
MKKSLLIIIVLAIFNLLNAQIAVGHWRDHLAYNKAIRVVKTKDFVYCASETGLFFVNLNDYSINKLSKVTGLSDVEISTIAYSEDYNTLLIAYKNANIDLFVNNTIVNISDIYQKQIIGNKTINNVLFIDNLAYLSCGFGIVVLDIINKEIKDTYYIGENGTYINVNEIAFDGSFLYAATNQGIYKADINQPFLVNFENWNKITNIPNYNQRFSSITVFNNNLYLLYDSDSWESDEIYGYNGNIWWNLDTLTYFGGNINCLDVSNDQLVVVTDYSVTSYDSDLKRQYILYGWDNGASNPKHAVIDEDNKVWIADYNSGLFYYYTPYKATKYCPNGPISNNAWNMDVKNQNLVVVAGSMDASWNNKWKKGEFYSFANESWTSITKDEDTALTSINDLVNVAIDPSNSSHYFLASWYNGLIEIKNGNVFNKYNSSNSTILSFTTNNDGFRVYGMTYDDNNNLWITNSGSENPICVLTPSGQWYGLQYSSFFYNEFIGDIIITKNNHKWVVLPRGKGIFAFDDKGTLDNINDDDYKYFTVLDENGISISNDIYSIAEDNDGKIWLGTNKGIVVYNNPENVFTGENFYGQQIIIEIDGNVQYLLETETVTAIEVDGANRKWVGTQDGGLFLLSEDGTSQIYNFNFDNSPLISNQIKCLALDQETGELFIGTDKGIVSYRSDATSGDEDFNNVYVFPNPVKETYQGLITITGLVTKSNVKITDISGNIVYETTAKGGQATWDGNDFNGNRVHTGVYLVFCTNDDGSKTYVTKILFIN